MRVDIRFPIGGSVPSTAGLELGRRSWSNNHTSSVVVKVMTTVRSSIFNQSCLPVQC